MIRSLFHSRSRNGLHSAPAQGRDALQIGDATYVVVDTELTGLNPKKDSIVSIGAIRMHGGQILLGEQFARTVKPRTSLTAQSVVVHGITPSEVSELPTIDSVIPEFLTFCGGSVVVGHVVSIDLAFLNDELLRISGAKLRNPAVDTHRIHRWLQQHEADACAYYEGNGEATDLFGLAKHHGIPVEGAHDALNDAFVTAQLFQRFLAVLPARGIGTVADLLRIGRP